VLTSGLSHQFWLVDIVHVLLFLLWIVTVDVEVLLLFLNPEETFVLLALREVFEIARSFCEKL